MSDVSDDVRISRLEKEVGDLRDELRDLSCAVDRLIDDVAELQRQGESARIEAREQEEKQT